MARTALAVQETGRSASETITMAAADTSNGNYFDNDSQKVLLLVHNDTGGPATVTIDTPITFDGLSIPSLVVTVADGAIAVVGPFPEPRYSQEDADSGTLHAVFVDVNVLANLAAVKVGPLLG